MASSKSINVFLIDGNTTGRIKCTMQNWTGVAYRIPRKSLDECSKSGGKIVEHLRQSGIYFLIGYDEDNIPSIYVGQAAARKNGEGLLNRLIEHRRSESEKYKDYWNEAICFTTLADTFGPTEISYLENKFKNLAENVGRYKVCNGNEPNMGNVTEEKTCELEEFIEYAKIMMGVLGHKVFEPIIQNQNEAEKNIDSASKFKTIRFNLKKNAQKIKAMVELTDEGYVLLPGSQIKKEMVNSVSETTIKLRKKYKDFIIYADKDLGTTTKPILFDSPSAASSFVKGSSTSGNREWVTEDGKTPKDF